MIVDTAGYLINSANMPFLDIYLWAFYDCKSSLCSILFILTIKNHKFLLYVLHVSVKFSHHYVHTVVTPSELSVVSISVVQKSFNVALSIAQFPLHI
jgi:hypothetical protein